ncbi:uncharacterized protein LOC144350617 [Saccoglossus kowalevskii]
MGPTRADRHLTCSLGPARYAVKYTNTGKHAPECSIASRGKVNAGHPSALVQPVDTHGFQTPGPNYRPNSAYWGRGAKKSLGLSNPSKHETLGPGPAAYTRNDVVSNPAYTLAKRLPRALCQVEGWPSRDASDTPGPNAYSLDTTVGKGVAMSIRSRQPVKEKNSGPSPNVYILPDCLHWKTAGIVTNRPFEHKEETKPSPVTYEITDKNLVKAPAYTCRKGCKPCFPDILHYPRQVKEVTPGPGHYHKEKKFTVNDKPAFSMGKRAKKPKNEVPGPNHYAIAAPHRPDAKKAPSFSMSGMYKPVEKKDSPGPAAYFPKPINDQPRYSMSKRHTVGAVKNCTPAANNYKIVSGQTAKGVYTGACPKLKARASPFVYSGLTSMIRLES